MKPPNLDEIRSRAKAARGGPWCWFGDAKWQTYYLATKHGGRHIVLDFARAGMQRAQPRFNIDNRLVPARELAIYEVNRQATDYNDPSLYRHDIVGFRSPDADFIAHSREDVDTLLEYIYHLEQLVGEKTQDGTEQAVPV